MIYTITECESSGKDAGREENYIYGGRLAQCLQLFVYTMLTPTQMTNKICYVTISIVELINS